MAMESAKGKDLSLVKIVPFVTSKSATTRTGGIRDVRVDQSVEKTIKVGNFRNQSQIVVILTTRVIIT